jgi:very-short-patch-repair endonuclease
MEICFKSRNDERGYNFNRQRPVLNYVADFMCKKLNLIIEVDGISHTFEDVYKKDVERQKNLETAGFTIIRLTDAEVLNEMQTVKRIIFDAIEKLERNQV